MYRREWITETGRLYGKSGRPLLILSPVLFVAEAVFRMRTLCGTLLTS